MKRILNHPFRFLALLLVLTVATMMLGCASSVSRLSADGGGDEIIFPDIKKDAWIKDGIYPNVENLQNVQSGMTKDQLYALLGHPHFKEGFGRVREWDYVFNFRNQDNQSPAICQYKVVFAPNMMLRSTYWKPASCANWVKLQTPPPQTVIEKVVTGPTLVRVQLSADGMFAFDKSSIADLRPGGVQQLNQLVENLQSNGEIMQLKIVGFTDRLGEDAYNLRLSQSRADAIRQYLIQKNIPSERISLTGVGESRPLVVCSQASRSESLIRCLAPNRRFELEAWLEKKVPAN